MPDGIQITNEMVSGLLEAIFDKLRGKYILPEVAAEVCQVLEKHQAEGEYADIDEGEFLAYAITQHMQAVSQDEHLWVRFHESRLPEHHGSLLQNEEKVTELKAIARQRNYGIPRVECLAGNVGLIEIHYFYRPEWGAEGTIVSAMNFLATMEALIVDLRECQGGNPDSVTLISSYLFEGEAVHLNSLYWRDEDKTEEYWTRPDVPGPRIGEKPVYVLTSKMTFSAGEDFAYSLQALKRAVLVGETTSGGAHPGSPFRLHDHFEIFVPMGMAVNPVTGTNWEGVGVAPDVAVPAEDALDTAHQLALGGVVKSLEGAEDRAGRMLLAEALAKLAELKE